MQRVSALLPSRERTKSADGKAGAGAFNRIFGWADRIAAPKGITTNNTNGTKVGREVYWPTTLDIECIKAARILKSFCSRYHLTRRRKWCFLGAFTLLQTESRALTLTQLL